MKVWIYITSIDKKFDYLQIFIGKLVDDNFVKIEKSLIEFGNHEGKQNFQKAGEKIMPNYKKEYDWEEIQTFLFESIFEDLFNFENRSFKIAKPLF